jgi:hypothetical protein
MDALTLSVCHFPRVDGTTTFKRSDDSDDEELTGHVAHRPVTSEYAKLHWNGVMDILETLLRSSSASVEHLIQSFYFYLLPSTHYFVPLSMYAPTVPLFLAALIIFATYLWISRDREHEEKMKLKSGMERGAAHPNGANAGSVETPKREASASTQGVHPVDSYPIDPDKMMSLLVTMIIIAFSFSLSSALLFGLSVPAARHALLVTLGMPFSYAPLGLVLVIFPLSLALRSARYVSKNVIADGHQGELDLTRVKTILLLVHCAGNLLLFLMNYSLSFFCTILPLVPIYLFPVSIDSKYRRCAHCVLVMLHPVPLLFLFSCLGCVDASLYVRQVLDAHLLGKWFLWAILPTYWSTLLNFHFSLFLLEERSKVALAKGHTEKID